MNEDEAWCRDTKRLRVAILAGGRLVRLGALAGMYLDGRGGLAKGWGVDRPGRGRERVGVVVLKHRERGVLDDEAYLLIV